MFKKRRITRVLVSFLVAILPAIGYLSGLKTKAIDPGEVAAKDKRMPAGVSCYLLGPVDFRLPTSADIDKQLQLLEDFYKTGKLKKPLYDFRKKSLLEQRSELENNFMNNPSIREQRKALKSLYKSYFFENMTKEEFEKRQKEIRNEILEITHDPSLTGPTMDELYEYREMLTFGDGVDDDDEEAPRIKISLKQSKTFNKELQDQMDALLREQIKEDFSKDFEYLELLKENNEINLKTYDLMKQLTEQQQIYCLRNNTHYIDIPLAVELRQKQKAGELQEREYNEQMLELLKKINEKQAQKK